MEKDKITILSNDERKRLIRHENVSFPVELETNAWRLRGTIAPLLDTTRPRVVIVGSRDPWPVDLGITRDIVQALSQREDKPIIISGLAMGTDTHVHKLALEAGLITYGVMPLGLDTVYPRQNTVLAERMISEGGGLMTWYKDGQAPIAINFLLRMHLMIAMADLVIIDNCRSKGSSMIAGSLAYEYGIPTLAVPGLPTDTHHAGCNELISQGKAKILKSMNQLTEIVL